nr:MAG TPA: hypothetical protein [Caudoviricetes sp.]
MERRVRGQPPIIVIDKRGKGEGSLSFLLFCLRNKFPTFNSVLI